MRKIAPWGRYCWRTILAEYRRRTRQDGWQRLYRKGGGHIRVVIAAIVAVSVAFTGANIGAEQAQAKTESSGETGNHRISSDKVPSETAQEWRTFEATAYIALCNTGCTGVTATGLDVRQHIAVDGRRVVAVDPAVIPLGTTLTIRLADGTEIDAIAADTGGAIKGARIDVLMANLHDAKQFGRQAVSIKIEEDAE